MTTEKQNMEKKKIKTTEKQKEYLKINLKECLKTEFYESKTTTIKNERFWNCLIASILCGENQKESIKKFCNDIDNEVDYIYLEAIPEHPRDKDGDTHLDISFGNIQNRKSTKNGIEFNSEKNQINEENKKPDDKPEKKPWVCFVEGKLYSDCSKDITHDPFRNQIIRVIDNLLCFHYLENKNDKQSNKYFPENLYFVLLTPRAFKEHKKTRLYGYKYLDYYDEENKKIKHENIINDLLEYRDEINDEKYIEKIKKYNDSEKIENNLKINWVTYEEIIEDEYKDKLQNYKLEKGKLDIVNAIKGENEEQLKFFYDIFKDLFKNLDNIIEVPKKIMPFNLNIVKK